MNETRRSSVTAIMWREGLPIEPLTRFDDMTDDPGVSMRVFLASSIVNTPPAKAGGFGLRLKAGSIGRATDYDRRLG